MTQQEKIDFVKNLINDGTVTDATITAYLSLAESKIVERCYPMRKQKMPMPTRYEMIQVELASRYIFRRGVEGQKSSNENGISRGYDSVNDSDLLNEVVQVIS